MREVVIACESACNNNFSGSDSNNLRMLEVIHQFGTICETHLCPPKQLALETVILTRVDSRFKLITIKFGHLLYS